MEEFLGIACCVGSSWAEGPCSELRNDDVFWTQSRQHSETNSRCQCASFLLSAQNASFHFHVMSGGVALMVFTSGVIRRLARAKGLDSVPKKIKTGKLIFLGSFFKHGPLLLLLPGMLPRVVEVCAQECLQQDCQGNRRSGRRRSQHSRARREDAFGAGVCSGWRWQAAQRRNHDVLTLAMLTKYLEHGQCLMHQAAMTSGCCSMYILNVSPVSQKISGAMESVGLGDPLEEGRLMRRSAARSFLVVV